MAEPEGHIPIPILEGDWPAQAATSIEQLVTTVRDRTTVPALTAARAVVYALVGGPLIIVAHSAGCIMTAHWAKRTHCHQVIGALLAAPPDLETAMPQGYPTLEALRANGWLPVPREPLPFPSIVAASENDPLGRFDRVLELDA